eukprot:TRINITY_DN6830_c0_g1_i1.p1 TRINITY_DN6830_c0_g1~~TRINITY_DN6830_c0_g1_i1.p1  ORF type:complete len:654 (+),score=273.43 TRINITY_DN6830_c0_g1_i1:283-2244(+)
MEAEEICRAAASSKSSCASLTDDIDSSAEGEVDTATELGNPSVADADADTDADTSQTSPRGAESFNDLLSHESSKRSLLHGCQGTGATLVAEDDEGFVEYKWKLVGVTEKRFEHLVTQMKYRVAEGQGECLYEVGVADDGLPRGLSTEEYEESVGTIKRMAATLSCEVCIVCEKVVSRQPLLRCCELLIRKVCRNVPCMDLRIAICGNVDSGKSTLTGVLTTGELDNGRGSTRQSVFRHKHEIDTGRTSAISQQVLGFDASGNVVNYNPDGSPSHHILTNQSIVERSSKVITLFDLAGHEKYLKTTVFGMTGCTPDYAALVLSANNGIQRMTKEHLGLCLALKMPVFGIITRIDACPETIYKNTVSEFKKMLKLPGVKKLPYLVKTEEDAVVCAKNVKDDRITPIFCVSNVTGQGLGLLKKFLNLLPMRRDWTCQKLQSSPFECLVENIFFINGVGTVVSGMVTRGSVATNDVIQLGPDGNGTFRQVTVKSIHVRGFPVKSAVAGCTASFALKKEKRGHLRKGMVLLGREDAAICCMEFEAEVVVLYHSTTIQSNYQPVVHCRTVRQSAKIELSSQEEQLRTGDKATVRFRFLYRPEYLTVGAKLVFREGRTKGIGTVSRIHPYVPSGHHGHVKKGKSAMGCSGGAPLAHMEA